MYQAVHFKDGKLLADTSEYLRRHDIVYNTPPLAGYEGLPLGNGSFGGLVYHDAHSLLMTLNHTDAVSFAPDGNFKAWAWESEEKNTAPFSCGKLSITSPLPLFDWVYLEEFEERLNLADASLSCRAKTPFSTLALKMYACENPGVMAIELHLEQAEEAELLIRLEKWATPNFFHHYEQVAQVYDKGLAGTVSLANGGTVYVTHTAGAVSSALAARAAGQDCEVLRDTSHSCALRFPAAKSHKFTLYIAAEVADSAEAAARLAEGQLSRAGAAGEFEAHQKRWHDFWGKSFIHIDDDYIENLYYIHLYQLNSCARGKYPPLFGGLWTWFGDSRNWGHFYHWNHQQTNWGLYAAGHPELVENYLEYRYGMLKNAVADAKSLFGARGAYYSDISNLNGYNAHEPDTVRNLSVGAQIALDFYRHWQYTQDEVFLRDRAVPMLRASLAFYADMLERQSDGRYRVRGGSTAYESYWNLMETLTDYAAIHALLCAAEQIGGPMGFNEDEWALFRDIQKNLFDCPTERLNTENGEITVFAAGRKWDGETVRYGEGDYPLSPFPAALTSMVYPAGLVGISQKNTEIFITARNTARVLFDRDVYNSGKLGCSGHAPTPQMAARLGMAEDAGKIIGRFAATYQIFPNGLMHFADLSKDQQWSAWDHPRVLKPCECGTQWEEMHEKRCGERTKIRSEWFLHCYFEAAANLVSGLQEALLQSHDGVIRVFPAVNSGVFRLWAPGGFAVSAERVAGETRVVLIESTFGGGCNVENPWPDETMRVTCNGETVCNTPGGAVASFATQAGKTYSLCRLSRPVDQYYANGFDYTVNNAPKHMGENQLGLNKIY